MTAAEGKFIPAMRSLAIGLAALGLCAASAGAQQLERTAAPVSAEIDPDVTVPGGKVTVSGSSVPLGDNNDVSIAIRKPDGSTATMTVQLGADQGFSQEFSDTSQTGDYAVTVRGPGGSGEANLSFRVVAYGQAGDEGVARLSHSVEVLKQGISDLSTAIAEAPPSPPQQEMQQRLDSIRTQLDDMGSRVDALHDATADIVRIVDDHPELGPSFAPFFDDLSDTADEIGDQEEAFQAAIAGTRGHSLCDALHYTSEALTGAQSILSLTAGLAEQALEMFTDMTADALTQQLPPVQRTVANTTAIDQVVSRSVDALQGLNEFVDGVRDSVSDLIPFAVDSVFERYCRHYTGTVKGTLKAEFMENGRKWWAYDTALEGTLNLRYDAADHGASVPVTGEITGVGTAFSARVDFTVLDPRVRRNVLARYVINPVPGIPGVASHFGLAGVFTPKYFHIPVRGLIEGSKVKLQLDDATQDFRDSAKSRAVYVLADPALPVPYVLTTELPYQGAHFILTRVMTGTPEFDISVDTALNLSRIQRQFTRHAEMQDGNIKLDFTAEVEACNPECP